MWAAEITILWCAQIYKYGTPAAAVTTPVTGQYMVELQLGDVVEVVIQNSKNNASSEPRVPPHFLRNLGRSQAAQVLQQTPKTGLHGISKDLFDDFDESTLCKLCRPFAVQGVIVK